MAEERIPVDSLRFLNLEGNETRLGEHTWERLLLIFLRHLA